MVGANAKLEGAGLRHSDDETVSDRLGLQTTNSHQNKSVRADARPIYGLGSGSSVGPPGVGRKRNEG